MILASTPFEELEPTTKATRAAAAFECLRAMDPHASERAELSAAGVSPARIDTLYGGPFTALAPTLQAHLATVPAAELFSMVQRPPAANELWTDGRLKSARFAASNTDLYGSASVEDLVGHVLNRYHDLIYAGALEHEEFHPVATLTAVTWNAYWFMTHRAVLTPIQQSQADTLMLVAARNLRL